MAVYNAQKFLGTAIESVLSQTMGDFELLVTYQDSIDGSLEVIRSYRDPRIRVLELGPTKGVADARKTALEKARGEYIATLDADDFAYPGRLAAQSRLLDESSDVGLVGAYFEIVDESNRVESVAKMPTDNVTNKWKLLTGNTLANSATMFRKQIALELGGYDKELYSGEDFELWTRFAARSKIVQLDQVLAKWRRHSRSLTHTEPAEKKRDYARIVAKSVELQTGQKITYEVAEALFRDIPRRAKDLPVLRGAYQTIANCLRHYMKDARLTKADKRKGLRLALGEIQGLSERNPGSDVLAQRLILRNLIRYEPGMLSGRQHLRMLLSVIFSPRLVVAASSIKRRLKPQ